MTAAVCFESAGRSMRRLLVTRPEIIDLVGEGEDARIYPRALRQGVPLPAIRWLEFQGESYSDLEGPIGIGETRLQVDCYGADDEQAHRLACLVRNALHANVRTDWGELPVLAVVDGGTYRTGDDRPVDGSDERRYWASRDYLVTHKE